MDGFRDKSYRLLKNKFYLSTVTLFSLFLIILALIIIPALYRRILEERKQKLKTAVDIASSLALEYETAYRKNPDLDLDILQFECLRTMENLRYEKNEYFFVINGDGRLLMHPIHPELFQWNMSFETDHQGKLIFHEVLLGAMKDGDIFINTLWQSKYNDQIYEDQILYGQYFWQWDWVICSTLFTQDIKDTYRKTALFTILYILATALVIMLLLFLFINSQITKPLKGLLDGIHEIQRNNLDFRIKPRHRDEIGFIALQFNEMAENRKRFEEQLVQSQKMEIVGTIASGVSHDFNNVIGGISALAHLLQDYINDDTSEAKEISHQYLDTIELSCERASSIVSQLLTFSGRKSLKMEEVDLNDVFHHIEALCRITLDKKITITVNASDTPHIITADHVQLEQTILNLCINAGHAMTFMRLPGEPWGGNLIITKKWVLLENAPHRFYWKISIQDEGVGMDKTTKERIFDPFFTTKETGKGSGLGLAMANKIIKDHEGWIHVESEPGRGTVFSLFLPSREENRPAEHR